MKNGKGSRDDKNRVYRLYKRKKKKQEKKREKSILQFFLETVET